MPTIFSCCITVDCATSVTPGAGGSSDCFTRVLGVACPPVTTGTVATAYSQSVAASGGTAPYTYGVSAGALPPGLSLNSSTGAITGTPTTAQTYMFQIQATDANGTIGLVDCVIDISPAPSAVGGFLALATGAHLLLASGGRIVLNGSKPSIGGVS